MDNVTPSVPSPANHDALPTIWYVDIGGQRKGPLSASQVQAWIADGQLQRGSLAWQTGAPDWLPLGTTEFRHLFADTPPPIMSKTATANGLVWLLAFAPLLGAFLGGLIAGLTGGRVGDYWWMTLALNIVVSLLDERRLKKAGHDVAAMGSAWLIPVYLYRRARTLKQSLGYFIVWCVCFALSLIL